MAAALTLAGAIVVALITAVTTDKRLSRQINAERERQERDLAAGAERQRADLAHDRELAYLADLRNVLDEAALALNDAQDARGRVRLAEGWRDPDRAQARQETAERGRRLVGTLARVQVRLGTEDPIATGFDEACGAWWDVWHNSLPTPDENSSELIERHKRLHVASETLVASTTAFRAAAVERVGQRVAKVPVSGAIAGGGP